MEHNILLRLTSRYTQTRQPSIPPPLSIAAAAAFLPPSRDSPTYSDRTLVYEYIAVVNSEGHPLPSKTHEAVLRARAARLRDLHKYTVQSLQERKLDWHRLLTRPGLRRPRRTLPVQGLTHPSKTSTLPRPNLPQSGTTLGFSSICARWMWWGWNRCKGHLATYPRHNFPGPTLPVPDWRLHSPHRTHSLTQQAGMRRKLSIAKSKSEIQAWPTEGWVFARTGIRESQ